MTGDELKAQAIAWFGESGWQSKLAALLHRERTTVWRWVANDSVPDWAADLVRMWQNHGLPDD